METEDDTSVPVAVVQDSVPVYHLTEEFASPLISSTEKKQESEDEAAAAAAVAPASNSSVPPLPNASALNAVDKAHEEVGKLIERNELDEASSSSLQTMFREHEALKDKVSKLKVLLGRSAKAQREAKVELDATNKRLESTLKENHQLQSKIDKLASRPTHMELLADFETNFDRALLSVGHHQSGGQDTSGMANSTDSSSQPLKDRSSLDPFAARDGAVVDTLLMQELSDSKQRVEKLEKLNTALVHRSSQLEGDLKQAKRSMDDMLNKLSHLELEKRMAVMEADQATRAMHEKAASLAEMQMEIDLVTKSAQKAAVRAAVGEEMIKTVKSDKQHSQHLEEQAKVLQEWALASNHAKSLAQERVRLLEYQLKRYQQNSTKGSQDASVVGSSLSSFGASNFPSSSSDERILVSKKASLVIGAGAVEMRVIALDTDLVESVNHTTERIVLRWNFDLVHEDADIYFTIVKGACTTAVERTTAEDLLKERLVKGGAGGETESAFATGHAITLVWSNRKSWVKPRTVKYFVEAVVLSD